MDPGGHGRRAHDNSEDDGDPNTPGQERQPTREDGTLTVFFPVPHTVRCCEEGCRAAYAAAKWTARRQSLQRHLEIEHGTRIRRTVNVCSICGETLGQRPASHACLAATNSTAPPVALPHQCGSCSMSFPTRRGLSNHEQWHRREAALAARRDLAAGAASGASEQDDDSTPPTEQDSTEGPAEDPPETPAVAIEQAADQEPSPVAPPGTPGQSSDSEMAEVPSQRTPTPSGRAATSATPSPTPSLLSNRGSPGAPASEAHEPAAMQELSPGRAEVQDHDGSTQDFGTQDEHAGREDFVKRRHSHPGGRVGTTADLQESTRAYQPGAPRQPAHLPARAPSAEHRSNPVGLPSPPTLAERPMFPGASTSASAPCRAVGQPPLPLWSQRHLLSLPPTRVQRRFQRLLYSTSATSPSP
nr:translation initiation factor IF-2-like [Dermacentor andersoni]